MSTSSKIGKVVLAGAGPGDPELITLKALRLLQQADVVITDRLVSSELIDSNIKPGANVIHVGKQGGSESSMPQETINDLLVHYAQRGALVLRLKGGDISFFSNVLDELNALTSNEIPFEIIPGVTAASGAAAYAGIPLTARGYSSAVRFLTYHKSATWSNNVWADLASTNDTLVFYMSGERFDTVVERLVANGIANEKYVAIVEQATTPSQNAHVFSLREYQKKMQGLRFTSPTIMIVGRVAVLHEQFQWVENSLSSQSYFKSLTPASQPV